LNARAARVMAQIGLGELDPDRCVKSLGVGQQQLVEIAAGLSRQCQLLILDEPTAALTDPEIEQLFGHLHKLRQAGVGIIYISHRLEEIQKIADRITVLRDGAIVTTRPVTDMSLEEIVRQMVGRSLGESIRRPSAPAGPIALRVQGLHAGPSVQNVSFEARRCEILGFAGLMGSGRTETMRAIFGADRREAGQIFVHDLEHPVQIRSPRDAVRSGLALLTEDRKEQGLLLPLTVRANITLMRLGELSTGGAWIRPAREQEEAQRWRDALQIRCASVEQPVA